jgi:hypothetical protein
VRIISKERDFYDRAGIIDRSICFVRETREEFFDIKEPKDRISNEGLIGFCGKFYPYIHIKVDSYEEKFKIIPEQHYFFYSYESYRESEFWENKKRRYRWSFGNREADYKNYFTQWKDDDEPFLQLNTPIFRVKSWSYAYQKGKVVVNPILLDYQFGKIKDAQTAFQDIQMYLTNQLVRTKDPDAVEDKYRITQHGFDKQSFRHPIKLKDLK